MITLLVTVTLSATLALRAAPADAGAVGGPSLAWVDRGGTTVVEIAGIDPDLIDALRKLQSKRQPWTEILAVRVARPAGDPEPVPIVGRYEIDGSILRFTPRYPFLPGTKYVARFHSSTGDKRLERTHTPSAKPPVPAAKVVAVYPTSDVVPENLLKLYLHFSAPLSRGEAYRRVRILDASGRPIERPFLEIGEELWDREGKRLTLLFDPGRIKRGLVPREEEGPILEQGKTYTLIVDAAWPDADNQPLASGFRKAFTAGPPDEVQPDPKRWTLESPAPGSRDPLVVRFPEPLDHAMLGRAIEVQADGASVRGRVEIRDGERVWQFVPESPWPSGQLTLRVDSELEDLAGNSIARAFEVDVVRDGPSSQTRPTISVPVPSRP